MNMGYKSEIRLQRLDDYLQNGVPSINFFSDFEYYLKKSCINLDLNCSNVIFLVAVKLNFKELYLTNLHLFLYFILFI